MYISHDLHIKREYNFKNYKKTNEKKYLRELLLLYMDAIERIIIKFENKGIEHDELLNIAILTSIKAIDKCTELKKLGIYLNEYIDYELNKELKNLTANDMISYEEYYKTHKEGQEDTYYDSLEHDVFLKIFSENLENLDYPIRKDELSFIKTRYGLYNGKATTLQKMGEDLNLSKQSVSLIEKKILRKLAHPARKRQLDLLVGEHNIIKQNKN